MAVLLVVGLLLAMAAPNLFSLLTSSSLTGEGTLLRNQLTLAQQTAVSKSADVEVRFFRMADDSAAQIDEEFRGYQLFQYNIRGELAAISEFQRITPPVTLHPGLSTLLSSSQSLSAEDRKFGFLSPREGTYEAPTGALGSLQETPYVAFRFRPDGSTDLPYRAGDSRDTWYLTLVQGEGAINDSDPDNYVCLQVNPYNGQVSEFRP